MAVLTMLHGSSYMNDIFRKYKHILKDICLRHIKCVTIALIISMQNGCLALSNMKLGLLIDDS